MFTSILYFILITVSLSIYISYHIYHSFFNQWSLSTSIFIIILVIWGIITSIFWNQYLPLFLRKIVSIMAYTTMLLFLYTIIIYFVFDMLKLFVKVDAFKAGIITFSLAFIIIIAGYINTRFIRETHYSLSSDKIPQDIKVVMISDLHIGALDMTIGKMKSMVSKINNQNPDIIIIAGDIVDNNGINIEKLGYLEILKNLHSPYGTFITLGNHEYYFGSVQNVLDSINKLPNTKVLDNIAYSLPNLNINIIGLSDKGVNKHRTMDLSYFPLKEDIFNIIVEHNPVLFKDNIKLFPADLQLSGHTHAGQVFLGYIIELLMYDKPWGLLKQNNSTLITSSGVGTWGPPVRDSSYPEVVLIDIKKE